MSGKRRFLERDAQIIKEVRSGGTQVASAKRYGLSRNRVSQIVRKHKYMVNRMAIVDRGCLLECQQDIYDWVMEVENECRPR